jgi:hypothetical protein
LPPKDSFTSGYQLGGDRDDDDDDDDINLRPRDLPKGIPLLVNFRNCGTPVKTKLLSVKTKLFSVKFELGPWQICWKFSDL